MNRAIPIGIAIAVFVAGCAPTPEYQPIPAGVFSDEDRIVYGNKDGSPERLYYVVGEVHVPGAKAYFGPTTLAQSIDASGYWFR